MTIRTQTFFKANQVDRTEMRLRLKNAFVLIVLNDGSCCKPHESLHISCPIGHCWFEKKNCLLAFSNSHFIWNILILNLVLRGKKLITNSLNMTFCTKAGLHNRGICEIFILRTKCLCVLV